MARTRSKPNPVKWMSGLLPNRRHKASKVGVRTLGCVLSLQPDFPRLARTHMGIWNLHPDRWLFVMSSFLKVIFPTKHGLSGCQEGSPPPLLSHQHLLTPHYQVQLQPSQISWPTFFLWLFTLMVVAAFTKYCSVLSNVVGQFFLTENR